MNINSEIKHIENQTESVELRNHMLFNLVLRCTRREDFEKVRKEITNVTLREYLKTTDCAKRLR